MLRYLVGISSLPWCVIGDFNDLMYEHEKRGGRVQPRALLEGFTDVINECGVMDLGFVDNEFTREKSRGSAIWIQERQDRGCANQGWRDLFMSAEIKVLKVSTSYHSPLFLELKRKMYVPKTKKFRFENIWIKDDQCFKIIQDSWGYVEGRSIVKKVEYCCLKLEE